MKKSENKKQIASRTYRPPGITIAALFMFFAGFAEIATGFTHHFLGISTSGANLMTISSVIIGVFYALSGLLILTMKKQAAIFAVLLLAIDILGRIGLVLAGLYPIGTLKNTLSIIAGTMIVAIIAIYIIVKLKTFR